MDQWIWVVIAVVAVVAFWLVVGRLLWSRPKNRVRRDTGPAVRWSDTRAGAEEELAARLRRHKELDLRPLDPAVALRYAERWNEVQLAFVELPEGAVSQAQGLLEEVMRARGYPEDGDLDERVDLVWVDHPEAASRFREGFKKGALADGAASTEEFRGAFLAYRGLVISLLEHDPDDAGPDDDATAPRIPAGHPPNVPDRRDTERAGELTRT